MNIVASTAGGTGAGVFLPLALYIKGLPVAGQLEINLVLVTSSAFDNEPLDRGFNRREMQTKGRTGTFAIIRELELLERADSKTAFPNRRFPISTLDNYEGRLTYRLGSRPFHRVYWMGRRSVDLAANKLDVYRESDLLLRILSNAEAADDLDGMLGMFPQRLLPSVVSVDYPRLARARRLSSGLAEAAVQQLIEGEIGPASGRRFFEYPRDEPGAFGKFLRDNQNRAFAVSTRGDTNTNARVLDELVQPYTDVSPDRLDYAGIPHGTARARGGYASAEDDWRAYCASLSDDLKQRWRQHEERIDQRTRERIREEGIRFRKLVVRIAGEHLHPDNAGRGPYPLQALRTQCVELRNDLDMVRTFFEHRGGLQGRLPEGASHQPKYASAERIHQLISAAEAAMLRPEEPPQPGGLPLGRWLLLLLAAAAAGTITWFVGLGFPALLPLWLVAAVVALATAVLSYALLRRRGAVSLPELRQREERGLLRLYEDRVFAQTAHALRRTVVEDFIPSAADALGALDRRIDDLEEVYAELRRNAHARASEVYEVPLHSVEQVGDDVSAPPVQPQDVLDPLKARIAIAPHASDDHLLHDLQFTITTGDSVPPTNGWVGEMADAIRERQQAQSEQLGAASRGALDLASIDAHIDSAATTSLASRLPRTFEEALRRQAGDGHLAALDRHLAALVHRTPSGASLHGHDRRRSSVDCDNSDPTVRRLYVPSVEVQALVVKCMQGEGGSLVKSVREELQGYMGADGRPLVVPELGASLALLSVWVPEAGAVPWSPTSIMATREGRRAHDAYFGLAPEAGLPGFISQRARNFQILPELAAAAAIELSQAPAVPLRPCVVSRLLGSHPEAKGPALLELFYLLRADGAIQQQISGDAISPRDQWEIGGAGPAIPLIDQAVLAGAVPETSEFGTGRRIVNVFDAFHEFMLYDGAPTGGMIGLSGKFLNPDDATVPWTRWAALDNADLARRQRATIERWWQVESRAAADRDLGAMLELLDQDVAAMDGAEAAEDWRRAVDHVLRRGCQKRCALADAIR